MTSAQHASALNEVQLQMPLCIYSKYVDIIDKRALVPGRLWWP